MRTLHVCIVVSLATLATERAARADERSTGEAEPAVISRVMPRVRSESAVLESLIARAYTGSSTFRRLVDSINRTDGIVYVQPGRCRGTMPACMPHAVTVAGPNRILQVWVRTAAADCQLMASIGHELQHVTEVLRDRSVKSNAALYFFYAREGRHTAGNSDPIGPWETERAVETGLRVLDELRQDATLTCPTRSLLPPSGRSAAMAPGVSRR